MTPSAALRAPAPSGRELLTKPERFTYALVAAALKLGVEEDVHQLAGEAGADDAATHAQGVGVVVAAGILAAEAVRAAAGTDALDLVCGHADAHTGAAEQQCLAALAAHHGVAGRQSHVRVVHAGGAVGAEVDVLQPQLVQMGLDGLFQFKSAVVGGKCDGFRHWC